MKRARPTPPHSSAFAPPIPLCRIGLNRTSLLRPLPHRIAISLSPLRAPAPPALPYPTHTPLRARPRAALDSPNLKDVNDVVITAVEKLARQKRLTVPDVAAASGLDLTAAQDELVTLASLTGAAIDVTDAGELAYRFPRDVRAALRASSLRAAARMAWARVFPLFFTAVRVSFGALLLLSILVTFLAIAALASASRSDDDRRDARPSFSSGRLFAPDIFDVMFYSRHLRAPRPTSDMSFLEAVYSLVFGDGDPNAALDARRWRTVAAVIRANRGAVTAEQLAPYLDLPPSFSAAAGSPGLVDESYVLPVLQRFQGHPEVTDAGDIIYVFPSLATTGSRGPAPELAGSAATGALAETELTLSRATGSQKALVAGLGLVNVLGVLTLGSMMSGMTPVTADAAALLTAIGAVYPALCAYAASFVFIPLARFLRQRRVNADIRIRNRARAAAAAAIARPDGVLMRKIVAATDYAQRANVVTGADVVYSSDVDLLDQRAVQEDLTGDFDRRLSG